MAPNIQGHKNGNRPYGGSIRGQLPRWVGFFLQQETSGIMDTVCRVSGFNGFKDLVGTA